LANDLQKQAKQLEEARETLRKDYKSLKAEVKAKISTYLE
jgi:hypothetical protein